MVSEWGQVWRALRQRPWQSSAVFLIIAVGIGMSSAFYSVAEALLLRPLPFDRAGRLVDIEQRLQPSGSRVRNSQQNLDDLRQQSRTLDSAAVYRSAFSSITVNGRTEYAEGMDVDRYFFPLLGVEPALGRTFAAGDEQPGAPGTILISYSLWQQRFAGDPTILGKEILLDKRPYTVIGVMPQSFYFPLIELASEDFWLPLQDGPGGRRGNSDKYGIARIKPGASLQQAKAEMAVIASHITRADPEAHSFNLRPFREVVMEDFLPLLGFLAGIMLCVLLVVCINVASLLLVEAMRQRREVEIRFALGGTRWQIARLFLLRALALAFAGGMAGAGLAWALVVLTRKALPAGFPEADQIALNIRWLWFTAAVSLGTGMLFGVWPALAATQQLHRLSLSGARQAVVAISLQRSRRYLVALQLAFSASFLLVTGLLGVSFYRLLRVDPGIRLDHRLGVWVMPTDPDLKTEDALRQFYLGIEEKLLSAPGVRAVAASSNMPLTPRFTRKFRIKDAPAPKDPRDWTANVETVGSSYFRVLGIAVRKGRSFEDEDRQGSKLVAIVNESFARRFLGGVPALGKQIGIDDSGPWREIVGIVADARDGWISSPPEPTYFVPFPQSPQEMCGQAAFTIRTDIAPRSLLGTIQKQMSALAPRAVFTGPYTLEELRSRQLLGQLYRAWFLAAVTTLALLLAAMGVYGVIAGTVEQRRHEIGIRMALGASPQRVAALFYRQMSFMLLPGLLLGLTGAAMVVRFITSILFGTTPLDPVAYCGATLVLTAVAAIATALPIRRALRVSAAEVLRAE